MFEQEEIIRPIPSSGQDGNLVSLQGFLGFFPTLRLDNVTRSCRESWSLKQVLSLNNLELSKKILLDKAGLGDTVKF